MKIFIRIILFLVCGFILFCAAYFVKSRLPFQFAEDVSIHQYFPFNYLARKDTFELEILDFVLAEDFDKWAMFSRWYHIWAKERDKVDMGPNDSGFQGTGCFAVVSRSEKTWSLSPAVYIEVASGSKIVFEALVMRDFESQGAGLRLVGFDRNKQPIDKRLATVEANGAHGEWEALSLRLSVPEDIAYITPRIRGTGTGKTRVDNIRVSRN